MRIELIGLADTDFSSLCESTFKRMHFKVPINKIDL